MIPVIDIFIVLLTAFGFNLIPFAGPSNLLIASNFAILLVGADVTTLVEIGFLIALGAAFAKCVYYLVTFFVNKHLNEKWRAKLDYDSVKLKRWGFLLLFVAAATPVPDEPVVIPLGLMKYNPAKFFTSFFLGKLVITIPGAFIGSFAGDYLSGYLPDWALPVASIILTVIITAVLLKYDLSKIAAKLLGAHNRNMVWYKRGLGISFVSIFVGFAGLAVLLAGRAVYQSYMVQLAGVGIVALGVLVYLPGLVLLVRHMYDDKAANPQKPEGEKH
jgi:membrane protein DedA with SNARE-associated domain